MSGTLGWSFRDGDWAACRQKIQRLASLTISPGSIPNFASVKLTNLTSGRIPYVNASQILADVATLLYDSGTDTVTTANLVVTTSLTGAGVTGTYLTLDQSTAQTVTASPILDWLTASQAVMTDANKKLVSADYLDQSVKIASSPTFAGLITNLIEATAVGTAVDFLPNATGNLAARAIFFKNAATGVRPILRFYGYQDSGTGSPRQRYGDIYIDEWGRLTFAGTPVSVMFNAPILQISGDAGGTFSQVRWPSTGAHGIGDSIVQKDGSNNRFTTFMLLRQSGSYYPHFIIGTDHTFNYSHPAETNPTIFLHSANLNTTQFLKMQHDGTDGIISTGTGDIQLLPNSGLVGIGKAPTVALDVSGAGLISSTLGCGNLTIGYGAAGTDYTLTFDGETNDGLLTWMEDEDYFKFSDDILMNSTEKIYFNDTSSYIFDDGTDLELATNGNIKFGTYSAIAAETLAGYITIKDSAGNTRKLAVIA